MERGSGGRNHSDGARADRRGAGKFWIADLVDDKDITDIIYVIIGIAALVSIPTLFGRRWP